MASQGVGAARSAVVTGVSTGIGHGIAKVLAGAGWRVFGTVRKQADADRLQAEFGTRFTPLMMDVTDPAAIAAGAEQVRQALGGRTLDALVNNAGVVLAGPLLYQAVDEFRKQMEINLVGPFMVVQAFAPLLGTDKSLTGEPGRIVNISSVAGKMATPLMGAYSASKHAFEGYSDALRRELSIFGIKVVIIGPGSVVSDVFGHGEDEVTRYANTPYKDAMQRWLAIMKGAMTTGHSAEHLGEAVLGVLTAADPKPRLPVVAQPLFNWLLPQWLPTRAVDNMLTKAFGLQK